MPIDTERLQLALADFIDQRVITALDTGSPYRWLFGGASTIALSQVQNLIKHYTPILKTLGIIDDKGKIILEVVETFLNSAFEKQSNLRFPILGIPFNFNKEDGDALISLLKQYGDI